MKFQILCPVYDDSEFTGTFYLKDYDYLPILPPGFVICDGELPMTIQYGRYFIESDTLQYKTTPHHIKSFDRFNRLGFGEYRQ